MSTQNPNPTYTWNQEALNYLRQCHPQPPHQGLVGRPPSSYLNDLPQGITLSSGKYNHYSNLNRNQVRAICVDSNVDVLEAYAVAMAWGGQRLEYFRQSIESRNLTQLLQKLRVSQADRPTDFQLCQQLCAQIQGLGISFYTKLLYFFRPQPDAYIFDQWIAKSSQVLIRPDLIRMYGDLPHPNTTPQEYGRLCRFIDKLTTVLWPNLQAEGHLAEAALFDEGYGRGSWRNYVIANWPPAASPAPNTGQTNLGQKISPPPTPPPSNCGTITLTWTGAMSYIKVTHPRVGGNSGLIAKRKDMISLTNDFIDAFPFMRVAFDNIGAVDAGGTTPRHGGTGYYKTKRGISFQESIEFLRSNGFSIDDNT